MSGGPLRVVLAHIKELREDEAKEDCWYVLPDPDDGDVDWFNFVVEIEGPEQYGVVPAGCGDSRPSPYAGGLFRLQVKIGPGYPAAPPELQFITKVWHPNVDYATGKPCKDIVEVPWHGSPSQQTLKYALLAIRQMLSSPSADEAAVNTQAAGELREGPDVFDKHAAAETQRFAKD